MSTRTCEFAPAGKKSKRPPPAGKNFIPAAPENTNLDVYFQTKNVDGKVVLELRTTWERLALGLACLAAFNPKEGDVTKLLVGKDKEVVATFYGSKPDLRSVTLTPALVASGRHVQLTVVSATMQYNGER